MHTVHEVLSFHFPAACDMLQSSLLQILLNVLYSSVASLYFLYRVCNAILWISIRSTTDVTSVTSLEHLASVYSKLLFCEGEFSPPPKKNLQFFPLCSKFFSRDNELQIYHGNINSFCGQYTQEIVRH